MQVKKRILVTLGVLAGLNLALLGAGAVPAMLATNDYKVRISAARDELDTQYALLLYARNIATTFKATMDRLATLHDLAIEEGGELAFITALERVAETAGVEQRIELETANQKDLSPWEREIPLKLEVSGTFPQVLRYLNAVERLPYLITVSSITIGGPQTGTATNPEGRVEATAVATVYWQALDAPAFVRGGTAAGTAP